MASANYYLADSSNANKVYFDIDPVPRPTPIQERSVGIQKCLPGSSTAGYTRVIDMGVGSGASVFEINLIGVLPATYAAIKALYDTIAEVTFSPDNGTTKYLCAWEPGRSCEAVRYRGVPKYQMTLRLRIISVS